MQVYILASIAIVTVILIFFFLNKKLQDLSSKKTDQVLLEWLKSMQTSIDQTNKTINEALRNTNKNITTELQTNTKMLNQRLDNAARIIAGVSKNIGEMSEIGRSMKELQEFLRSPKLRGNIGEQILKEILGQMLPKNSFHLQYSFASGTIVDAAIKTEAGIIPIDSKFPIENFRKMLKAESDEEKKKIEKEFVQDVKKHIESISKKYILTGEGTIDYALMYVPSEAVYYEIVNNPALFDFASQKMVLPVSPMTFYAYLKAILMGFEGQKISKRAQEILAGIKAIKKDYEKVGENLETLARHINNSYNSAAVVSTAFSKLGQAISSTSSLEKETEKTLSLNE